MSQVASRAHNAINLLARDASLAATAAEEAREIRLVPALQSMR
jgi:hypothetical protein